MTYYIRTSEGAAELTTALKKLLTSLEPLVRDELNATPDKVTEWKAAYAKLKDGERTSETWLEWSDSRITQVASSWILLTIFTRFCEDNELFGPSGEVFFAGPTRRRQEALELRLRMFSDSGTATDQTWLDRMFTYLEKHSATQPLVGDGCPARLLNLGPAAAGKVVEFWHTKTDDGELVWDFTDKNLSTRFLGDLYQDLSEAIRKKYALLQTPEFVEEFILDHTLDPALREFPLNGFKMIDPTCGSGHFLLGGFDRIFQAWQAKEPGTAAGDLAQRTLDSVCGVDINPYAIAISRFRLLVKAMHATGDKNFEKTKCFSFQLVCADSLTKIDQDLLANAEEYIPDPRISVLAPTQKQLAEKLLLPGTYHVVVGNPPYITPKDKAMNRLYRADYTTCHRQYAMTVPFMERFFDLACTPDTSHSRGFVGQITSNSFMKREFGKKLIQEFLPHRELTHVIDTAGAYIPGHGTPTVTIIGRGGAASSGTIRAVLGIQGEPGRPEAPAKGLVWSSIRSHTDDSSVTEEGEVYEDQWISVVDIPRDQLESHPWSLVGGGAAALVALVEDNSDHPLSTPEVSVGGAIRAGADEAYLRLNPWTLNADPKLPRKELVMGDGVRDWHTTQDYLMIFPYVDANSSPSAIQKELWPYRQTLAERKTFQGNMADAGLNWWSYMQFTSRTYDTPLSITFAEVATHNHFVLDRGGKVFNRTAPVIKLPKTATEDDHLQLLGVLNSSIVCFWLRQNCYNKGSGGNAGSSEPWEQRFQYNGRNVSEVPIPGALPLERGRRLDELAQELNKTSPHAIAEHETPTTVRLEKARLAYDRIRALMIAEQEELDWECYQLYGLIDENLCYEGTVPELALGERAFEITLARTIDAGTSDTAWFDRHNSTPTTTIPAHLPADYQELIQRRLDATAASKNLRILEAPEHKRRWQTDGWDTLQKTALHNWLLTQIEHRGYWFDNNDRPRPRTINELATEVGNNDDFTEILNLWNDRRNQPIAAALTKLLDKESVPHAAALRLKDSGMRKRREWETTWDMQRQEDAGTLSIDPLDIPVPPEYKSTDFLKPHWWKHRGKLDVPKERFISYPGAHPETDTSELLGWAGWDHAQQATALASIMMARSSEGAAKDVITPLLVGLHETLPWVNQWHPDIMPEMGMSLGAYLDTLLESKAAEHGLTIQDLPDWRPPATKPRRTKKATS